MFIFQAFLEKFFTYSKSEKSGSLQDLELYYEDSPSKVSKVSLTDSATDYPEIHLKNKRIASKTDGDVQKRTKVYFSIFLHIDFFQTNRYIPHDLDIHIRLIRCAHFTFFKYCCELTNVVLKHLKLRIIETKNFFVSTLVLSGMTFDLEF